ncbi:NAD(P)-dependent oxidoreductase, partial [Enterococcus lactis]|nr:NAD(P)-dependent oxidoreductase [Enterococcus lactis]
DVTSIVRHPEKLPLDVPFIQTDLDELTATDLVSFDVVVDDFNALKGKEEMHQTSLSHLIEILEGHHTRIIVVGGASTGI